MVEGQQLLNILLVAGLAAAGWFARQLWESVTRLKNDLKQLEVNLPTNYVRKEEMTQAFERVEKALEKIFDKLDGKADK